MSETMTAVMAEIVTPAGGTATEELARHLLAQARSRGVDLVGADGLLRRVTKLVRVVGHCDARPHTTGSTR